MRLLAQWCIAMIPIFEFMVLLCTLIYAADASVCKPPVMDPVGYVYNRSTSLAPFYSLATSFINAAQHNVLPYDRLTELLQQGPSWSTLSPIIWYEAAFITLLIIGLLFVVCMPMIGCIFCCCRCCNNCGGKRKQKHPTACFWFYVVIMIITFVIVLVGCVLFGMNVTLAWNALPTARDNFASEIDKLIAFVQNFVKITASFIEENFESLVGQTDSITADIVPWLNETLFNMTGMSAFLAIYPGIKAICNVSAPDLQHLRSGFYANSSSMAGVSHILSNDGFISEELCNNLAPRLNFAGAVATAQRYTNFSFGNVQVQANIVSATVNGANKTLLSNIASVNRSVQNIVNNVENFKCNALDSLSNDNISGQFGWIQLLALMLVFPVALVLLCILFGLICGLCGYRPGRAPFKRTSLSNQGGNCMMAAVAFAFIFGWILMILVMIVFGLGYFSQSIVCNPLFQNGDYTMLDILQNEFFLYIGGSNYNLNVSKVIEMCKQNNTVYNAFELQQVFNLNAINASIANIVNNLQTSNFSQYFDVNVIVIGNVTDLNNTLSIVRSLSNSLVNINQTYNALQLALNISSHPEDVLHKFQGVVNDYVTDKVNKAYEFSNQDLNVVQSQLGFCTPLYEVYVGIGDILCKEVLLPVQGIWLALGWCLLFYIPTIIFGVKLAKYFRRMKRKYYRSVSDNSSVSDDPVSAWVRKYFLHARNILMIWRGNHPMDVELSHPPPTAPNGVHSSTSETGFLRDEPVATRTLAELAMDRAYQEQEGTRKKTQRPMSETGSPTPHGGIQLTRRPISESHMDVPNFPPPDVPKSSSEESIYEGIPADDYEAPNSTAPPHKVGNVYIMDFSQPSGIHKMKMPDAIEESKAPAVEEYQYADSKPEQQTDEILPIDNADTVSNNSYDLAFSTLRPQAADPDIMCEEMPKADLGVLTNDDDSYEMPNSAIPTNENPVISDFKNNIPESNVEAGAVPKSESQSDQDDVVMIPADGAVTADTEIASTEDSVSLSERDEIVSVDDGQENDAEADVLDQLHAPVSDECIENRSSPVPVYVTEDAKPELPTDETNSDILVDNNVPLELGLAKIDDVLDNVAIADKLLEQPCEHVLQDEDSKPEQQTDEISPIDNADTVSNNSYDLAFSALRPQTADPDIMCEEMPKADLDVLTNDDDSYEMPNSASPTNPGIISADPDIICEEIPKEDEDIVQINEVEPPVAIPINEPEDSLQSAHELKETQIEPDLMPVSTAAAFSIEDEPNMQACLTPTESGDDEVPPLPISLPPYETQVGGEYADVDVSSPVTLHVEERSDSSEMPESDDVVNDSDDAAPYDDAHIEEQTMM